MGEIPKQLINPPYLPCLQPDIPTVTTTEESKEFTPMTDYATYIRQQREKMLQAASQAAPVNRTRPPPVLDQIRAILAALPPASVMRPWSLDELRGQVIGRFGRPPQRGEIAAALKLLNFRPVRLWSKGFDGRHVWLPEGYEFPQARKEQ